MYIALENKLKPYVDIQHQIISNKYHSLRQIKTLNMTLHD